MMRHNEGRSLMRSVVRCHECSHTTRREIPTVMATQVEPSPRVVPRLCTPLGCSYAYRLNHHGESSLCGSPFIQEIQDTPISQHIHLPALEAYDGGSDLTKHVNAFRVQMALYGTLDAIMCRALPTTLRGVAHGWYDRLPLTLIHSFDQLAREFEANFLTSAWPKLTIASLLGMRQKEDEPLGPYLTHFTKKIRAIPDTQPSLVI
ncbi:hypothetical protein BHE74_00010444 [Ensete ventricosum]|nr:hypothetical protein BHE74_00010444 [Ensete ventricosum]RZS19970.1 hypothetical protein BHM03_00052435 [Ensete ventricosum]